MIPGIDYIGNGIQYLQRLYHSYFGTPIRPGHTEQDRVERYRQDWERRGLEGLSNRIMEAYNEHQARFGRRSGSLPPTSALATESFREYVDNRELVEALAAKNTTQTKQ